MQNNAQHDIDQIQNNGNKNKNLIHSTQNNFYGEDSQKIKETLRLQLKSFLDGNLRIANTLAKNSGLPIVERFDLFKAEELQGSVLALIPEVYAQFHDLRLTLEKANRIIETAHTEYRKPHSPVQPRNNAIAAGYWLQQLRLHTNGEVTTKTMQLLGGEYIVGEDGLHK